VVRSDDASHLAALYARIRAVIRRVPRGRVATYGQVAELAGVPRGGRIAAAALKTSSPADRLPWQRIIGKRGPATGRIAIHDPIGAAVQRRLLEREGVVVDERGAVSLARFGWAPAAGGAAGRRPAKKGRARATASPRRGAPPRPPPRSGSRRRASPSRR
jgi:methylated-DNA-protein-cysteine methyltransferase related protein